MSDFSIITQENLRRVGRTLSIKKGSILIVESGFGSFNNGIVDAHLSFFSRPFLDDNWLSVKRGEKKVYGETHQTNWEGDRDYVLRPKREPTGNPVHDLCCDLFEKMIIGSYEFKIGFQATVGRSVFAPNGLSLFVPKDVSPRSAFYYGLSQIIEKMNAHNKAEKNKKFFIWETDIGRLADYAIEDLRNSEVFRKNVSAGMEADRIYEKI